MNHLPLSNVLIDGNDSELIIELGTFTKVMKEIIGVINYFIYSLTIYDETRPHNMLTLMLDSKLKSLRLICFFIGHKDGMAIVKEYDRKSLFPMLLNFFNICIHCSRVKGPSITK
jgi:hypothetical protein